MWEIKHSVLLGDSADEVGKTGGAFIGLPDWHP